jgi:hypothetical protein
MVTAQVNLLPSIGVNVLPSDNDSVCYIPMYMGGFGTSGIQEGDTASDFKLYTLAGDSVVLSDVLNSGKPVLMVAGSYTCPVFRNKVNSINNVKALYGNQIETFIVYTIEAHPDIDTSVYFGFVNTGSANISAGILYRQPKTYGERKAVVTDMLAAMNIQVPVYLDGPCNNWWSHYGPAPNNAYLINTDGTVFAKHGWYDKYPDNIICDIDSLLGNPSSCNQGGGNGQFQFILTTNDTIFGAPGSIITLSGDLINNNSQDLVVDVYRLINNLPAGWESSLCIDVCYPTTTDSATILLPASTTLQFHFYIYTTNTVDTARARVGFRNQVNPNNQMARNLWGITMQTTGLPLHAAPLAIEVFPNPMSESCKLIVGLMNDHDIRIEISDLQGRMIKSTVHHQLTRGLHTIPVDLTGVSSGILFVKVTTSDGNSVVKRVVRE